MDLAIGGLNDYSVKPLNYSITNESTFSTAYTDSVKKNQSPESVKGTAPVRYPDAELVENTQDVKSKNETAAIQANKSFNQLADSFGGAITSYGSAGTGSAYEMVGSLFDAYA